MSEINDRWARDNRFVRRLTTYAIVMAPVLWAVSYYTSQPANGVNFSGAWFGITSMLLLAGAVATTVGAAIGGGIILTDEPPLPGSNR